MISLREVCNLTYKLLTAGILTHDAYATLIPSCSPLLVHILTSHTCYVSIYHPSRPPQAPGLYVGCLYVDCSHLVAQCALFIQTTCFIPAEVLLASSASHTNISRFQGSGCRLRVTGFRFRADFLGPLTLPPPPYTHHHHNHHTNNNNNTAPPPPPPPTPTPVPPLASPPHRPGAAGQAGFRALNLRT